ncbi:MAG TPA: ATP-binding protein [Gemmatimonadaceae bacterium]
MTLSALLPMAVSMALLLTLQGMRAGRRRSALNEAVHELRRPLQAIALAGARPHDDDSLIVAGSVHLVTAALERLDREINGQAVPRVRRRLLIEPLARSAVRRWQSRAALRGAAMKIEWRAGGVLIDADGSALSQALDNLIVNAIEHGGPTIVVEGRLRAGRLRVTVADSGRGSGPASRRDSPVEAIARLTGRRRHGHGLAVVRRVAAAHGGRFVLRRSASGAVAALELPLAAEVVAAA